MPELNAQPESIYPPTGIEECLRVVRLANPALPEMVSGTWQAGFRVVDYNWQPWLEETFIRRLLPLLGEALRVAAGGMGRELLELDRAALAGLPDHVREASGRAGRLLLRHGVPAGAKVLRKLADAAEKGETPGHLATVFAARCGIFSIPPRQMALGYLFMELRLGAPDWNDRQIIARMEETRPVIEHWLQTTAATGDAGRRWSHG